MSNQRIGRHIRRKRIANDWKELQKSNKAGQERLKEAKLFKGTIEFNQGVENAFKNLAGLTFVPYKAEPK